MKRNILVHRPVVFNVKEIDIVQLQETDKYTVTLAGSIDGYTDSRVYADQKINIIKGVAVTRERLAKRIMLYLNQTFPNTRFLCDWKTVILYSDLTTKHAPKHVIKELGTERYWITSIDFANDYAYKIIQVRCDMFPESGSIDSRLVFCMRIPYEAILDNSYTDMGDRTTQILRIVRKELSTQYPNTEFIPSIQMSITDHR